MKIPQSRKLPPIKVSALFEGQADLFGDSIKQGLAYYTKECLETSTVRQMDYALMEVLIAAAESFDNDEFDMRKFSDGLISLASRLHCGQLYREIY